MSFFKKIGVFYVNAHIHVALVALCMVLITGEIFSLAVLELSIFAGFSTIFSYNVIRFLKYKNHALKKSLMVWFENNKGKVFVVTGFSFLGLLFFGSFLKFSAFLFLIPLVFIVACYMTPVFRHGISYRTLRNLPFIKIFSIAFTWSGVSVILPFLNCATPMDRVSWFYFVYQFLFVFVWTLPFDLRDVDFDSHEMKTIPQLLGVKGTKILGVLILILMVVLAYFFFERAIFPLLFLGILLLFVSLLWASQKQSPFYASFWVESIPICQFVLYPFFEI